VLLAIRLIQELPRIVQGSENFREISHQLLEMRLGRNLAIDYDDDFGMILVINPDSLLDTTL